MKHIRINGKKVPYQGYVQSKDAAKKSVAKHRKKGKLAGYRKGERSYDRVGGVKKWITRYLIFHI